MNKITLKSFFLASFLLVAFSANAQKKTKTKQAQLAKVSVNSPYGVELNQFSQESIAQTGYVKCLTDEVNDARGYDAAAFEAWLAPLVEQTKQQMAQNSLQNLAPTYVYQLPIIFHVIYGNEAVGVGPNIDAQYVNAQIAQLNLDFRNLSGADTGFWAGRDLDARIEFVAATEDPNGVPLAEPGINRVGGYPGTLTTGNFDNTIKPATIWDRTRYVNNWTGDLGGILGYAQFPDSSSLPGMPAGTGGPANTDGVVCGYTSIGSIANPYPGAAPYNAGRTLTHEIGHWIGLRHIWGDGGCGVDDFCDDTPNAGGSNFGCANTTDSCPGDADRDMVENYMDYSDDACMNIFTRDQVIRMITVLQNSPGRITLVSDPVVSFRGFSTVVNEGTDCSFTDVQVELMIHKPASADAGVTVSVSGGTAVENSDYELVSNTVTIPQGSTTSQFITLRVYNDSDFENNETIDLTFTLNSNGGDSIKGEDEYTITINDDDQNPTVGSSIGLFSDNFESGLGNWTVTGPGSATNFVVANEGVASSGSFDFAGNATNFAFVNDDDCDCDMSAERLSITSAFDFTNYTSASLNFDAILVENATYNDDVFVQVSTNNGASWTSIGGELAASASWQNYEIDLSSYAGQNNVLISFLYNDNGIWGFGVGVDNVQLSAIGAPVVQTAVNTGTTNDQFLLTPNGGANAFDTSTGNNILDINVTNASDFGCTSAGVSRAGTSAQPFNGSIAPALVTDKTFNITPATVSAAGTSTISFYFTEAELAGWESATGDSRANLQIGKDSGASLETVSAVITTAFGTNWKVSGNFTSGISGTYYFGNMAFLSTEDFKFDNFVMYPNPSNGSLTIGFNTSNDVDVNLYDIRGRSVLNKNFKASGSKFNQTLNLASLATGVYVVKINSGSNTMFRKLVIN
jgi:hypothetical protein